MNKIRASHVEKGYEAQGKSFVCWGDCQNWHIDTIRYGIIQCHGADKVGPVLAEADGTMYFEYADDVDLDAVGESIGVRHSGPSSASSSSDDPRNKSNDPRQGRNRARYDAAFKAINRKVQKRR